MERINNEKIDFVVLWVDDKDPKWQVEKNKYLNKTGDYREIRYRDTENLQILFRGIEKYANWINKVFFVTYGHIPKWLNVNNEKLIIVNHKDFIPEEYLPTFNSNVIELNLHRIKELSEKFVLFNDDFFLLKKTKPEDFFVNDKPTDIYAENVLCPTHFNDPHFMMKANIMVLINKHFDKKECIRKNYYKFVNLKYDKMNRETLYCMEYKRKFLGFRNFHEPYSYLKETFRTVWNEEGELLNKACYNKFRESSDLGHYLFRYWQLLTGNFEPRVDEGKYLYMQDDNSKTILELKSGNYKYVCINDNLPDIDFEKAKNEINKVLFELLPEKSSFEI